LIVKVPRELLSAGDTDLARVEFAAPQHKHQLRPVGIRAQGEFLAGSWLLSPKAPSNEKDNNSQKQNPLHGLIPRALSLAPPEKGYL
jgi:hypothetical protein